MTGASLRNIAHPSGSTTDRLSSFKRFGLTDLARTIADWIVRANVGCCTTDGKRGFNIIGASRMNAITKISDIAGAIGGAAQRSRG